MDSERIATICLDAPGKRVNTLSRQMWADLSAAMDEVERANPVALIVTSAKSKSFVVGADLFEIRDMTDAEFDSYIHTGQQILDRLANLPITTVAAINGDALGGGLELALACNLRVCADDPSIRIGLPETKLGLIPAWGGTVRLKQLVGTRRALSIMIGGHLLDPEIADTFSVIDQRVTADQLLATARERIAHPQTFERPVENEAVSVDDLRKQMLAQPSLSTFAQLKLLQVIQAPDGFDAERRAVVELRRTPEAQKLLGDFYARQARKQSGG